MTQEEIDLIEELVYNSIQYQLRQQAPSQELYEIANDISDIKNKLKSVGEANSSR